eukprot:403340612
MKQEIKSKVSEICIKEIEDISRHVDFQDQESIVKYFDIKEVERQFENGLLNAVYSRLALKGLSGIIVIGAPGTGKTTFCHGLQQLLNQLDRKHAIVNLDPGNDNMEYECKIDIHELITQEDVMEEYKMGPNGSMIYCMEFLETNIEWLEKKILEQSPTRYFIFDLPGQVEIYSNHQSLQRIIAHLTKSLNLNFSAIHLVDCTYLYDKNRFLASMTLSLTAIIGMQMPFINAITKIDLMKNFGRPDMNLSFYNSISGLEFLFFEDQAKENQSPFNAKYGKLSRSICEVIENFNLVGFSLIDINNKMTICNILQQLDKGNGYFLDPEKVQNPKEMEIDYEAVDRYIDSEVLLDIEEKYFDNDGQEEDYLQQFK